MRNPLIVVFFLSNLWAQRSHLGNISTISQLNFAFLFGNFSWTDWRLDLKRLQRRTIDKIQADKHTMTITWQNRLTNDIQNWPPRKQWCRISVGSIYQCGWLNKAWCSIELSRGLWSGWHHELSSIPCRRNRASVLIHIICFEVICHGKMVASCDTVSYNLSCLMFLQGNKISYCTLACYVEEII